jgi:hypothetical protein
VLNAWGGTLDALIVPNNLDSISLSKKVEGQVSIEEGSQLEVILEVDYCISARACEFINNFF